MNEEQKDLIKEIEFEINFVLNFRSYEAEINEFLHENELDIKVPVTRYDDQTGDIYLYCPSVEDQAIRRISKREGLKKQLNRGKERVGRLFKSYDALEEDYQDVISLLYFERIPNLTTKQLARTLDCKNIKEFEKLKACALLQLHKNFTQERDNNVVYLGEKLKEERKQKVKLSLGESIALEN